MTPDGDDHGVRDGDRNGWSIRRIGRKTVTRRRRKKQGRNRKQRNAKQKKKKKKWQKKC